MKIKSRRLNPLMPPLFDHEKLEVYQDSLAFIAWLEPFLQKMPRTLAARDQLDRASTSILLNLAEGNGKFPGPDRCRFFAISRGSALECAAALDVIVAKGQLQEPTVRPGKERLRGIVSMLVGLIRANSDYRLHDSPSAPDPPTPTPTPTPNPTPNPTPPED